MLDTFSEIHSSFTFPLASSRQPVNLNPSSVHQPCLKVLGLGGGGSNAINRMIELGLSGVEFITANTDYQALQNCLAPTKIQLGPKTTRGLGAGGNPEIGQAAAQESWSEIATALNGADMVFLTAGMGGGTGTGSIPVAAQIARSIGAVTIAIVTMPFSFELGRRQRNASEGLNNLRPHSDTLISIPNDRLLYIAPRNLPLETAFRLADDVLRQSVQGITELITRPGVINVDFANVRNLMKLGGGALMSNGQGEGENKALKAIEQALHHPLLHDTSIDNAAGILVNFTCGEDLTLVEVDVALTHLRKQAGDKAEIILGVINDERLENRVEAILVVTGLGAKSIDEAIPGLRIAQSAKSQPCNSSSSQTNQQLVHAAAETMPEQGSYYAANKNNLDLPAFLRRPR